MADKTPVVIGADGLLEQLQAADRLVVAISSNDVRTYTNEEASLPVVKGAPVYSSSAGKVKLAKANVKATAAVIGLGFDATTAYSALGQTQCDGVFVATTAQWDAVTGLTGGLTFNTLYFLDPADFGKLTATRPVTVGQCVTLIGRGLSTTEMQLILAQPVLL
jgi:hypothetical protein